jgi:hypothetical protein
MSVAVKPTFHCVAVKDAAEMGPHPEPRMRAAVRRRMTARRTPSTAHVEQAEASTALAQQHVSSTAHVEQQLSSLAQPKQPVSRPALTERRAERLASRAIRPERRRVLVLGDRRTFIDQAAVVAMVAFAAVVLGFLAARI